MPSKKAAGGRSDLQGALRRFIRAHGADYLRDPNVTSIGVGRKNGDGDISLVFTVGTKAETAALESFGTKELPREIMVEGRPVPTDVLQRSFKPSYRVVGAEPENRLKTRMDPIVPGASVGHIQGDTGTVGMFVFDAATGAPCILSNWHVLHGNVGEIGDPVIQPGAHDDNNIAGNICGVLLRSHLGAAGDCALARLQDRGMESDIHDLGVTPARMADVELDDTLVKTGRTTGTTYGIVRRTDVMAKINYGIPAGIKSIGCFEIGPNADFPPNNGEISMGGDSGAVWMISEGEAATDIFAGLHFAGEGGDNPDEHALACYPASVQNKLDFVLTPPDVVVFEDDDAEAFGARAGYDPDFLGLTAPMPDLSLSIKRDSVNFGRAQTIPYTHFSVCLSARRRLPRFVAWNINGARKVTLGRHGFRIDPRIDAEHQLDNALYADNKLDRGHIARRADLAWGAVPEARQANKDSFFYTNIAPQHERYNQSRRGGVWGRLENLILEEADVQDIKVSVMAGPLFKDDDPEYRGARIPRDYWKMVAYCGTDGSLRASAFVLSQNDLLSDIEAIDFDPFRFYQVSIAELTVRTGLGFDHYLDADVTQRPELLAARAIEALGPARTVQAVREIVTEADVAF